MDRAVGLLARSDRARMSIASLQHILVPTDLSDFAAVALRWAALLKSRLGGRLTALYANQPWVPFDVMEGPAAHALQTSPEFRDRLTRDLRKWVDRYLPDAEDAIATRIVDGAPAQAIVDTAESVDADLIVMGTHGRTGWRRALLGSVTEQVIRHTDRAVLCIPPDSTPSISRILCPVNFTEIARAALEEACALAATFDAELLIVHVTDLGDEASDLEGEFAAWIDPHVRDRCRYAHLLASGNAAEEVIGLANETRADLIVLGSQRTRFADASVIGTTTERVIRFAKRPVWAVTRK